MAKSKKINGINKADESLFFTVGSSTETYSLSNQFKEHMEYILVKNKVTATPDDILYSLSLAIRDKLVRRWLRTQHIYLKEDVKRVYYLSLEFLMGRLLGNALINMDYYEECRNIIMQDGFVLADVIELEKDMGLGNGGLGRLAACFLDSMATLQLPAFGYGIRYEFGIFQQDVVNGWQMEKPDHWLSLGNPWEIFRRELNYRVKFGGRVESYFDAKNKLNFRWVDTEDVIAVGYDIPVPGYKTDTVNNLRLWAARATDEFSFKDFNAGNYVGAVESKNLSENISKVLYPNDTYTQGKYLRLRQQYFFVSASLQDIIRKFKINHDDFRDFPEKTAIQLNDTHPSIAIPELMRILLDEEGLSWETAWEITWRTFAYTNHTVVPEALEEWSVNIITELLPRHMQIIYEINHRFLEEVRLRYTADDTILNRLSIIREGSDKKVKMANLSIVGSHAINGVAALHTEILKNIVFRDFYQLWPEKFVNVTNGITPRRWLKAANPMLSKLISETIGDAWVKDLDELKKLEAYIDDPAFIENWREVKWGCKKILADKIEAEYGITVSPDAMFDVQIKRFHEYKRQLLNILQVISQYLWIRKNPTLPYVPRVVIFGGKAAPAYQAAKLVVKLIHNVAEAVNNDPIIGDKLKVVFIKNYSVTLAEQIIPASDLSEQISTAGFEASGTGNMKFALNGAITIGTMDGANVEIREEVGDENIFIFGLLADEVLKLKSEGYNPKSYYESNPRIKEVIDILQTDYFCRHESGIFKPIIDSLMEVDYYCLFADFDSYLDAQQKVSDLYADPVAWAKKSILNVARIGKFSSDRSIMDYAQKIWGIQPMNIKLKD